MRLMISFIGVLGFVQLGLSVDRSFVTSASADNQALLVSAANGLQGLDLDINMVDKIATHSAYSFRIHKLIDKEASTAAAKAKLTELSKATGNGGTLFFYFTGHGNKGSLYMGDQSKFKTEEIRAAIELGREGLGPIERLIVMYDSCFSGSMVDPLRSFLTSPEDQSAEMADAIIAELSGGRNYADYWKKLFVFASSTATQTSLASEQGSHFTLGLTKGFEETLSKKGDMAMLAELTKKYTKGHTPVERFAPAEFAKEPLVLE